MLFWELLKVVLFGTGLLLSIECVYLLIEALICFNKGEKEDIPYVGLITCCITWAVFYTL